MNKKLFIILGILAVIIVIIAVCVFVNSKRNEVEVINKTGITINGYTININSKGKGETSGNAYYRTSFERIDGDKNKSTYYVDFVDIKSDLYDIEEESNEDGIIYDVVMQDSIVINGKEYYYDIDESNWSATLYYKIPNENEKLVINVTGGNVYSPEGYQLKTLAMVNEKLLESNELANILDFTIVKSNNLNGNNNYNNSNNNNNSDIYNLINNNSKLPVKYMSKYNENDNSLKKYDGFRNFMSMDFEDDDILFSYYGYPNDESEYYLGEIELLTNKYNILGVTIGDNMKKSISKIEKYGFKMEERNNYFVASLKYLDFIISLESDSENYDEDEDSVVIGKIQLKVESEYLGNRLY